MNSSLAALNSVSPLEPIVHALAWTLLHFIWQGCVLAAAFGLIMLALRRSRASNRYLAGCITLGMMALTPIATFTWLWRTRLPILQPLVDANSVLTNGTAHMTGAPIERLQLPIVAAWLLGTAVCIIWVAGGWLQTRRFHRIAALPMSNDLQSRIDDLAQRLNIRCIVRIVDHLTVAAPLTLGAIKPVILLPAAMLTGLTPTQLHAILAHEMAHIRRMDFLVNLLQAALEALLFYHPAVWWISRQLRLEREYCCDDLAAEVCGNPVTYARALAKLEALRGSAPSSPGLALSSQGGSLMKRIARLTGSHLPRSSTRRWDMSAMSGGAAIALLAAGSSAFALAAQQAPPAAKPAQSPAVVEVVGKPSLPKFAGAIKWLAATGHDDVQPSDNIVEGSLFEVQADGPGDLFMLVDGDGGEGQTITADSFTLDFVLAEPTIDPEHMPSDGLVKAAQLAYPFNLLGLMPWVAPEATDVLVKPAVEGAWLRACPVESQLLTNKLTLARKIKAIEALGQFKINAAGSVNPGDAARMRDVKLKKMKLITEGKLSEAAATADVIFEIEPSIVEFRGAIVEGEPIAAIPAEKPSKTEPANPEPIQTDPAKPKP